MIMMNKAIVVAETRDSIEIEAPAKSDFFIDMQSGKVRNDAPFYFEKRKGDFVMRARVRPRFRKTYDAGGLFVYGGEKKWIKFEFEMTDLGYPSIVCVITDGISDDNNGERVEGIDAVWLQVARKGDCWALHFSEDGKKWKMSKYFSMKMKDELRIGMEAQSPIGSGCIVEFEKYQVKDFGLKDLRKGK